MSSLLATVGILAVGWQIGAANASSSTTTTSTSGTGATGSTGTPSTSAATPTPTASASATPTAAASKVKDGSYTGSTYSTRFGNVQVKVTISGGKITDVTPLQLTNSDGRSVQISNRAAPILRQEVLAAQSAKVSNVSGATYTTQGYLSSLQSALSQAGL